jgi:hypothetical protein
MAEEEKEERTSEEEESVEREASEQEEKAVEQEAPEAGEKDTGETSKEGGPAAEGEEELSEEELRKLIEDSLENITVADIVLSMMNQLASVAYLKMGMPESVNLKYRDFDQAKLAIDSLDAIVTAAEGKVEGKGLDPFKGTLANLKMNFVQLKRPSGSE